jgi:predicted nucleotide-binding protein
MELVSTLAEFDRLIRLADDVLQTHHVTGPVFESTPTLNRAVFSNWQIQSIGLLKQTFGENFHTIEFQNKVRRPHIYDVQHGRGILEAARQALGTTGPMTGASHSILSQLQILYDKRSALRTDEEGRRWIAKVCALVAEVDPVAAATIRSNAELLTLPLSSQTIGPIWSQTLQIVANTIALIESGSVKATTFGDIQRVFIGHGRSLEWLKLKEFISNRLGLEYDEFNREPVAGLSTKERLVSMLSSCSFAFLLMTAEDEYSDGSRHARENVIHEIGLFQGRLGFERAIVLVEDGCSEFSNIEGLTQIRFPHSNVLAQSEEIRRVLEREGHIQS